MVARVLTFVPIAGFALLIVANILQLAGMFTATNNAAAGIAWITLLVGMMLAPSTRGWASYPCASGVLKLAAR